MFFFDRNKCPMDVCVENVTFGKLFAMRRVSRKEYADLIELYIEDDGNYFFVTTFDSAWLNDLATVTDKVKKWYPHRED